MDIDIDVAENKSVRDLFSFSTRASMIQDGNLKAHPVGLYFQNIPVDDVTGLSAIPYKDGMEYGFFKIDFLNLSLLQTISTKEELRKLARDEPNWDLLLRKDCVDRLFQLKNHFDVLQKIKPKSILELAEVIALIRPGKVHLIDTYIANKAEARKTLWLKTTQPYYKKSHAIAYAHNIVVQMNQLESFGTADSAFE